MKGTNLGALHVPYLSSTSSYPLPPFHMLLRGLLLDLLVQLLGPGRDTGWLHPDDIKLVSRQSEAIHRVAEIDNQYQYITKCIKN